MKSALLKALPLAAIMLAGCTTTNGAYAPSVIEKKYLAQCATEPPTAPCGHH